RSHRGEAVLGHEHAKAGFLQLAAVNAGDDRIVFDKQDFFHRSACVRNSRSRAINKGFNRGAGSRNPVSGGDFLLLAPCSLLRTLIPWARKLNYSRAAVAAR